MAFFPIVLNSEKKVVAFTHYVSIYSIFSTSSERKEKLFESVCFKYYGIEQNIWNKAQKAGKCRTPKPLYQCFISKNKTAQYV